MLKIRSLNKSYANGAKILHVLKNIDLSIKEGKLVSLMGLSGSGKSTLLSILGVLDYLYTVGYELNGVSVIYLSQSQATKVIDSFIEFIYQSFNLITYKPSIENVALPLFHQKIS